MKLADEKSLALKTAAKLLIARCGGLEAAASACRVSVSNLSEYGSRNHPERHMPVDVALQLEEVAGEPIVTGALARMQGHSCVRPDGEAVGVLSEAVAAAARHAGEVTARFVEASADSRIDHRERADLLRHVHDLRVATEAMAAALVAPAGLKVVA